MLKTAKHAKAVLDDWSAHKLVDILYCRLWNRRLSGRGYATYFDSDLPSAPSINRNLLFARI